MVGPSVGNADPPLWRFHNSVFRPSMESLTFLSITGWWFGTWRFFFPYIGNNDPSWLSYVSEGWLNHQPAYEDQNSDDSLHQPCPALPFSNRIFPALGFSNRCRRPRVFGFPRSPADLSAGIGRDWPDARGAFILEGGRGSFQIL